MTPKQKETFNKMLSALKKIAKGYQTSSQLRKNSGKDFGLDFEEAIEMAYDNIQGEAAIACKGVKEIK